ncbi:hypothetical protein [uncultured Clostridium sp.]|uniref:hypothetical protein n=1 Tax=uncultured Clostridium sp. TaxID=59620 RepID=UPI0026337BB4|nr:hypothetical protein [uncultured Clostridium sp.]
MITFEKLYVSYEKKVILGAFTSEELIDELMSRDKDAIAIMLFKLAKDYDELKKEQEGRYVPPGARKDEK